MTILTANMQIFCIMRIEGWRIHAHFISPHYTDVNKEWNNGEKPAFHFHEILKPFGSHSWISCTSSSPISAISSYPFQNHLCPSFQASPMAPDVGPTDRPTTAHSTRIYPCLLLFFFPFSPYFPPLCRMQIELLVGRFSKFLKNWSKYGCFLSGISSLHEATILGKWEKHSHPIVASMK